MRLVQSSEHLPKVDVVGREFAFHEDLYHFILTLSWWQFFGIIAIGFALLNLAFAFLYWVFPGAVNGVTSFEDAFYFSIETISTIGYGGMSPANRYAHVLVSIEAFTGVLVTAMITGLTFAKFARPTAKVMFSKRLVIANRNGVPHLMIRVANWRHNQIAEAFMRVVLLVAEKTEEGEVMRRSIDVPLVRPNTPLFMLTWTAMHKVDESSPFFGPNALEELSKKGAEIYVAVTGVDETIATSITARYRYKPEDVVPNARYADVMGFGPDGTRTIDYSHFHDIVQQESKDQAS